MADFAHPVQRTHSSSTGSKKSSNGNGYTAKNIYEDVFGGASKFGIPSFSSRIEDYSEIFSSYNSSRGSSIPFLDLPAVDETEFSAESSKFDYSEIFGGFDSVDYAVPYEELFLEPKAGESSSSSEDVWTPVGSGSPSEESFENPLTSESTRGFSNTESHYDYDGAKQFNMSYHQTNQISREDSLSGTTRIAQLNAVPAYTLVVDENISLQPAKCEEALPEVAKNGSLNETTHDLRISGDHYLEDRPPQPACGRDQEHQRNLDERGTHSKKPFMTVSEISLRTQPLEVPPPSRPPPKLMTKQGSHKIMTSDLKSSAKHARQGVANDSSLPFFDVEVDSASSAAASAAAMKEAMEQAQATLKSAREMMGGLQRKKMGTKESSKFKEEKSHIQSGGMNSESKGFDREERQKGMGVVQTAPELEIKARVATVANESVVRKHSKQHELTHESPRQEVIGEWKAEEQFFELVKKDTVETVSVAPKHKKSERNVLPTTRLHDHEDNEKRAGHAALAQQVKSYGKPQAANMVCESRGDEKRINVSTEACERVENEEKLKAAQMIHALEELQGKQKYPVELQDSETKLKEACEQENKEALDREEREKQLKQVLEREEAEKKLKESRVREENEKRRREALQREDNERREREALEREENERREREENERREREALEREENERREREALEREEKERREREALEREENERREKEALDREENEKKREALVRDENEKRQKEAHEREEIEKRLKEAREREEEERRLEEVREREETERRLKEAREREETERRLKEAREREENERRLKEIREKEENERRLKEQLEREENQRKLIQVAEEKEKRLKEAREREESERRTKEAREREETERRIKEAFERVQAAEENREREETERRRKEAHERDETERRIKEAGERVQAAEENREREETERRRKEAREREEIERKINEACERVQAAEEKDRRLKEACEKEETERRIKDELQLEEYEKRLRESQESVKQVAKENERRPKEVQKREENENVHREPCEAVTEKFSHQNTCVQVELEDNLAARKVSIDNNEKKSDIIETAIREEKNMRCTTSQRLGQSADKKDHEKKEIKEERIVKEKDQEKERLRKVEEDKQREREREKDRIAVERVTREANERAFVEARERAERAAVERTITEARQRAMIEARERLEKACAEAREKSLAEKAYAEAKLRAERAAVERVTTEVRERAAEKAMKEKAMKERVERSVSEKFSANSKDSVLKHTASFSNLRDAQFQNSTSFNGSQRYGDKSQGIEVESVQRCKARLERNQRTVERAAKALADKNFRDHLAQREQTERNRLADTLDAEVKRWSNGKEGNIRALLSTLQYILGADSGWQPVPLTDVVTAVAVKKAYRKATLCVHPDKLQQRRANIQQKYICEKVFDLLQDAWNKYDSEER